MLTIHSTMSTEPERPYPSFKIYDVHMFMDHLMKFKELDDREGRFMLAIQHHVLQVKIHGSLFDTPRHTADVHDLTYDDWETSRITRHVVRQILLTWDGCHSRFYLIVHGNRVMIDVSVSLAYPTRATLVIHALYDEML